MSPGVNKVSSIAKKFDDSNKRHTVSYSNKTKERIDIFNKEGSSLTSGNLPPQPTVKDDSNVPLLNRSTSSSVMIKPHSNNNLNRMSSSPNLSSSPKNHSTSSDHKNSRNIKTNASIRKTIGNFEQLNETGGNSSQQTNSSVSERIARIERKPKQQSSTAFHHDRVKRNFNIRKNVTTADNQMTERFSKLLQQFESEKLDSPNYKEAMQLFERKSIRFTPSVSETWSNSEEDRLQELLRLLREEEMKRLELLENMLRKERESIQLPSSPIHSKSHSNVSSYTAATSSAPKTSTPPTLSTTNMKTLHTNNLMDKIKQERNDFLNKELEKEKMNLPATPTVQISGKPLKERPLPTPGTIASTPLNSFSNRTPRKSEASASNDPVDLQDFIEQKKKRLTMLPTNADDLFQMW